MRFCTTQECGAWLASRNRLKPDGVPGHFRERMPYPHAPHRMFHVAHWSANNVLGGQGALLWITEWGIWPSSENWHLYYRIRGSYGDQRAIHAAPGHMFGAHEMDDLASFLQLAMLNGWGGYVLTEANYANAFFSHDETIEFYSDEQRTVDTIRSSLMA